MTTDRMNILRSDDGWSRGHTLVELIVSMTISTMVFIGMGSAMVIASRALDSSAGSTAPSAPARRITDRIAADLRVALRFSERTATAVTFTVPDRDNPPDSTPETVRYAWSGTAGDPLTRQYNGGPEVTIADDVQSYNLTYLLRTLIPAPQACCYPGGSCVDERPDTCWSNNGNPQGRDTECATADCPGGIAVLLVVLDAANPTVQEQDRVTLMESWGVTVNLIDQSDTQANFDTAIVDNDVVYISEQVSSGIVGTKVTNATIGVVNEEPDLVDELGFVQGAMSKDRLDIQIVDNTHDITSELALGMLTIFSSSQPVPLLVGTESPDLAVLGQTFNVGSGYKSSLVTLSPGDALWDAGTAAGRRVQLPWGYAGFDINSLNADGQTIMRKAIEWASEAGEESDRFGYDTIFANVGEDEDIQIATLATLPVDATVSSITAYINGNSTKPYRFAIYSDSAGEPGNLIVETAAEGTSPTEWKTLSVPPTVLTAGTYWLALSMSNKFHDYFREDTGGQTRFKNHNAVTNGYLSTWGSSDGSFTYKVSIYADYTPQ